MTLRGALPLAILLLASSAAAQEPPQQQPEPQQPPQGQPPPGWTPPPPGGWPQQPPPGWPPPPGAGWQPPPAAPVPPARSERPTTVQGYAHQRNRLKQQLKKAEREDRDDDAKRLRGVLEQLEDWQREDVQRRSTGAYAGGIVMISVGSLSLLSGFAFLITVEATDAANSPQEIQRGFQVATAATLLAGLGLLGGGIPLAVWGGQRVMIEDATAPGGAIVVGAEGVRVEGSF